MHLLKALILCSTVFTTIVVSKEADCRLDCKNRPKKAVCGKNEAGESVTYSSFCELQRQECLQDKDIEFMCDGECPCDAPEIVKMDKDTVHKLQVKRAQLQLVEHEKDELNNSEDYLTLEILNDNALKKHMTKEIKNKMPACSSVEMSELPARLIDWFHVLKINEKAQEMEDQRIEDEPVMIEENFTNEKMRAMYSLLACTEQQDKDVEKAVCSKPVKWMFHHLDSNNDDSLVTKELAEIEEIEKEQCIKPFLQGCDYNKDGKVVLTEFCKCLCTTPPCTNVIKDVPSLVVRGEPKPMPGFFVPRCDDDGFFMPKQCNEKKECWCVDRNGAELLGSRKMNGKDPKCAVYNTKIAGKTLVPLDVKKENK